MRSGRPLRFLLVVLGGWTGMRAAVLWQAGVTPGALPSALIGRAHATGRADAPAGRPMGADLAAILPSSVIGRAIAGSSRTGPAGRPPRPASDVVLELEARVRVGPAAPVPAASSAGTIPPPLRPTPLAAAPGRLAGSAWLIARGGSGGTLLGGQLGGSQAGARLTYALGAARRVALSARIATPLAGRGREAAIGLDWQPTRVPLHLVAEQRLSLDGGHGGPTLLAVGGIGPTPVAAGFRLEAYGQAGVIARTATAGGIEGFGDGAARLTRRVASAGALRLDLGAGAWGAVQRGARRIDVGPTLGLVAPLGRGGRYRAVRLTLDWRERIGGEARPGSGPALSVGTDF